LHLLHIRKRLYETRDTQPNLLESLAQGEYRDLTHGMTANKLKFFLKSVWRLPLYLECTPDFWHVYRLVHGTFYQVTHKAYWNAWLEAPAEWQVPLTFPLSSQLVPLSSPYGTKLLLVAGSAETFLCIRAMLHQWVTEKNGASGEEKEDKEKGQPSEMETFLERALQNSTGLHYTAEATPTSYVSVSRQVGLQGWAASSASREGIHATLESQSRLYTLPDEDSAHWSAPRGCDSMLHSAIQTWSRDPSCPFLLIDLSDEKALVPVFTLVESSVMIHVVWLDTMHPRRIQRLIQQWFPRHVGGTFHQASEPHLSWTNQLAPWGESDMRRLTAELRKLRNPKSGKRGGTSGDDALHSESLANLFSSSSASVGAPGSSSLAHSTSLVTTHPPREAFFFPLIKWNPCYPRLLCLTVDLVQ
jgi:hypothetical protein